MNNLSFFNNGFQESFELNTDVFDTNIINLSIVLLIVIRFLGEALNNTLDNRYESINLNMKNYIQKMEDLKNKCSLVSNKLELISSKMATAYNSRFDMFEGEKQKTLNEIESYLKKIETSKETTIQFQTKKALSDVYEKIVYSTFENIQNNITVSFKQSKAFSKMQEVTTYGYLDCLESLK